MATDSEVDDDDFSSDECDPETEALLYSQIHHQETFECEKSLGKDEPKNILSSDKSSYVGRVNQTDSGICSPKNSRSPSPLEESRLQWLSSLKGRHVSEPSHNSSSDDDDDGIKVVYEKVVKLKESHVSQKKNVAAYTQNVVVLSSSEDSLDSPPVEHDIKLNITKEKDSPPSFQSFEAMIEKSSFVEHCVTQHPWSNQMKEFYNEINHAVKNKTIEEIWSELPDDPGLWEVNREDKPGFNASYNDRGRYFKKPSSGVRCNNCRERGHMMRSCPSPLKPIVCSMCGGRHRETRCDQSMCLRCGEPNHVYTRGCNKCFKLDKFRCSECSCFGHMSTACPNVWRQFHLTTREGGDLMKVDGFVPPKEKWCPNCAKKGHYLHQCTAYCVSPYPAAIGHVVHYNSSQQERYKRKGELAIKRQIIKCPRKKKKNKNKKNVDTKVLNALISQAKQKGKKKAKKRGPCLKRDSNEQSSKPRRQRKKSGKGKLKIFN